MSTYSSHPPGVEHSSIFTERWMLHAALQYMGAILSGAQPRGGRGEHPCMEL